MGTTTPDRDLLTSYLADRDVPCPRCGYNLRTLQSIRCPECGEELRLTVGLVHPKLGWFLTGLIGLAAGAGFSALLVIYVLITVMIRWRWRHLPPVEFWLPIVGGLAVQGLMLGVYLFAARRIRAAGTPARIAIAVVSWATTLLNIVVFSFSVR